MLAVAAALFGIVTMTVAVDGTSCLDAADVEALRDEFEHSEPDESAPAPRPLIGFSGD